MFVKQVKDFSGYEADLIITDGTYELMCYHYCNPSIKMIKEGTIIKEIFSLFSENIMRIESQEFLVRKESDHYSYYLHGKVIDKLKPMIAIGALYIKIDTPLAKDIEQGEFVELKVHRLDCFLEKNSKLNRTTD